MRLLPYHRYPQCSLKSAFVNFTSHQRIKSRFSAGSASLLVIKVGALWLVGPCIATDCELLARHRVHDEGDTSQGNVLPAWPAIAPCWVTKTAPTSNDASLVSTLLGEQCSQSFWGKETFLGLTFYHPRCSNTCSTRDSKPNLVTLHKPQKQCCVSLC